MKRIDLRLKSTLLKSTLICAVTICAGIMLSSCQKDSTGDPAPTPPPTPPATGTVVEIMDTYLKERYLWNGEYKTLPKNMSLAYDDFLDVTLKSMNTNTLDKKPDGHNGYYLYSFIEREVSSGKSGSSRAVIERPKHGLTPNAKLSYGIASITLFNQSTGIAILGVYPDSPAQKAGLKRGALITKFNGTTITASNVMSIVEKIYFTPTQGQIVLTDVFNSQTYTITSAPTFENPVLKTEVFTINSRKIGYLLYSSFEASYDGELLSAIKTLKDGGVTDLILDLRLNGGGHVVSANMLSSVIAGSASNGKVFQYYRYNDERMANVQQTKAETGNAYDEGARKFYERFSYPTYYGVNLSNYELTNLNKAIYCIVADGTASSSEAVINSLQGIGMTVKLIGMETSGKNVGMEPKEFTKDKYDYSFYPITFQSYNAKQITVPPLGLTPDFPLNDWGSRGESFADFSKDEVCVAKAISLITGAPVRALAQPSSRSTGDQLISAGAPIANPNKPQGAIILPQ